MSNAHPLQLVGLAFVALGVGVLILSTLLGLGNGLGAIFIAAGVPTFIMGTIGALIIQSAIKARPSDEGNPEAKVETAGSEESQP